ncbi:hypothetical protein [Planctomycetes bacterium TBK1r]|uniref:RDD family protein n=1 Tax=Stieleria magnilauensis TaxID=2527963 RepID=A0ABX5XS50_9BACT|nr:hypothetical protein TBK1r_27420 [Planctomycetes bacterium TBK1r]
MKVTLTECLEGMAAEIRWGVSDALDHSVKFTRYLLYAIEAVAGYAGEFFGWLYKRGYSQVDVQLSKRGTPVELRSALGFVIGLPALVVRLVLIGIVAGLWLFHAPQVAVHAWDTLVKVEQSPNKKRTPKKSRPRKRLDDFDDVRVRVSELTQ